jgi:hypothetical protein
MHVLSRLSAPRNRTDANICFSRKTQNQLILSLLHKTSSKLLFMVPKTCSYFRKCFVSCSRFRNVNIWDLQSTARSHVITNGRTMFVLGVAYKTSIPSRSVLDISSTSQFKLLQNGTSSDPCLPVSSPASKSKGRNRPPMCGISCPFCKTETL